MMHNWGIPSFFHSYKFFEGCWCEFWKVCFDDMLTFGEKYCVGLIWLTLTVVLLYSKYYYAHYKYTLKGFKSQLQIIYRLRSNIYKVKFKLHLVVNLNKFTIRLLYLYIFSMLAKFQDDQRSIVISSINCLNLSFCCLE